MPKPLVGVPRMSEAPPCWLFRVSTTTSRKAIPLSGRSFGDALAALIWYCLQQGWRKSAGVEAREPTAPISADRRPRLFVVGETRIVDRAAVCRRGYRHHPRGLYRRKSHDAGGTGCSRHLRRHGGERLCALRDRHGCPPRALAEASCSERSGEVIRRHTQAQRVRGG